MFSTTGPDETAGTALRFILRVSSRLAILGGLLMLALAVVTTASVLLRWATTRGIPGDFELAQMSMAVAIFAFLPICQLRGSNIFVATFTIWAPRRVRAALDGLWALIYTLVAGLVSWGMIVGGWETLESATTTMVLALPLGWIILAAAIISSWLTLIVLITTILAFRKARA